MSRFLGLVALTVPLLLAGSAASAQTVAVTELDTEGERWVGRRVTVRGELVGDYSVRSDVVWVQLNDDPYVDRPLAESGRLAGTNAGIGVRLPRREFDPTAWGEPGGYRLRGPIVQVTGTFHSGGVVESGDTFVDAEGIDLIEPARPLDLPGADPAAVVGGGAGVVIGLAALAWSRWKDLNRG